MEALIFVFYVVYLFSVFWEPWRKSTEWRREQNKTDAPDTTIGRGLFVLSLFVDQDTTIGRDYI
jgi:hypothetical protein